MWLWDEYVDTGACKRPEEDTESPELELQTAMVLDLGAGK